jgi:predicted dehydrogenase
LSDESNRARPVRLGIIGAGLATKWLHWPPLMRMPGRFKVAAVADASEEAAREVAEMAGGCPWTLDYRELLSNDDIEAVLVSLPIQLNAQVLVESAHAGKHVLCEKPIASNLAQAKRAVAAVRNAPGVVMIAENYRYRRDIDLACRWIDEGRIGRPFLIDVASYYWTDTSEGFASTPWRHDSQYRGGAITDAGVHQAAVLRLLGGEVEQLQAFTKLVHPEMSGIDTMVLNLRYRNGALGRLLFSAATVEAWTRFLRATVFGTEGTLWIEERRVRLKRRGEAEVVSDEFDPDEAYYDQLVNFHEAITGEARAIATPEEAMRDLEILMLAYDSAESRSVELI